MNNKIIIGLLILLFNFNVLADTSLKNQQHKTGLLLLAYGMEMKSPRTGEMFKIRNRNVVSMVEEFNKTIPTEAAFGLADPKPIQEAVDLLASRGVSKAIVVPVFVSSHSPLIGNFKYILGLQNELSQTTKQKSIDQISSDLSFQFASAMDTASLINQVLLERAKNASENIAKTTIILIAHGPENPKDNKNWMADMKSQAEFLQKNGGFKQVEYTTLRSNSPKITDEKIARLRSLIEKADSDGDAVLLPVALSSRGLSRTINKITDGLNFAFADGIMPHPNVKKWVMESYQNANVLFSER